MVISGMWAEKYRPRTLDEMVNQKEIVSRLKGFVTVKNMPHLLFVGPAGVGKVTSILALAHDLYGSSYKNYIMMLNVSDEPLLSTPRKKKEVDKYITKLKNFARTAPIASPVSFKMIIMDDANSLLNNLQQAFRRIMEMYTRTCRFCLLSTNSETIIEPIKSRCSIFKFSPLNEEDSKRVLAGIAAKENIPIVEEGLNILYEASRGDVRKAINLLQAAAASSGGAVDDVAVYKVLNRLRPATVRRMINLSLKGNFIEAREVLRSLLIDEELRAEDILEMTYNELMRMTEISPHWKIKLTDYVSQVDYLLTQTEKRHEIHLATLLTQLGLVGENTKR